VHLHFPQCWEAGTDNDTVALACQGTAAIPLGSVFITLTLRKNDGTIACVLNELHCTVIDLGVDIIIGRPMIRSERIVRYLPGYFGKPSPPSEHPQLPNAFPALQQTRDAVDQPPAPILRPTKPAGGQSRNKGKSLTFELSAARPPGSPELDGADKPKATEADDRHHEAEERSGSSDRADSMPEALCPALARISLSAHTPGKPFLGSVDVKRVKHVSELIETTQKS
jgi:hypothetical protein